MNSPSPIDPLIEVMLQRKVLSESNLQLILAFMERWQVRCYDALTETHLVSEKRLMRELSDHFVLESRDDVCDYLPEVDVLRHLSFRQACEYIAIPVCLKSERVVGVELSVIVADPTQDPRGSRLSEMTGQQVKLLVGQKSDIMRAIYAAYPAEDQLGELWSLIRSSQETSRDK